MSRKMSATLLAGLVSARGSTKKRRGGTPLLRTIHYQYRSFVRRLEPDIECEVDISRLLDRREHLLGAWVAYAQIGNFNRCPDPEVAAGVIELVILIAELEESLRLLSKGFVLQFLDDVDFVDAAAGPELARPDIITSRHHADPVFRSLVVLGADFRARGGNIIPSAEIYRSTGTTFLGADRKSV